MNCLQERSRKQVYSVLAKIITTIIVAAGFVFMLTLISGCDIQAQSSNTSNTSNTTIIISLLTTIVVSITGIIGVTSGVYQMRTLRDLERKSAKPTEGKEPTTTTGDISTRFILKAGEETNNELLGVERQRLELEKQKLQLEREQQNLGWQKEALAVVEVSPRAAILIAWIGVEQAIEYARNKLGLRDTDSGRQRSPSLIISTLKDKGLIDSDTAGILKDMQKLRNQVVHGQEKKEITYEAALDYVRQASKATKKLSSKEPDIVAVHLKMTDGAEATFQEWLTDPDKLKQYINVFSQLDSSIKPLQAIFVTRNGKQIVVDVSSGEEQNTQLDELLSYLKQEAFLR